MKKGNKMKAISIMEKMFENKWVCLNDIFKLNVALYIEKGADAIQVKYLPLKGKFVLVKSKYNVGNTVDINDLYAKWFFDNEAEYSGELSLYEVYNYYTRN